MTDAPPAAIARPRLRPALLPLVAAGLLVGGLPALGGCGNDDGPETTSDAPPAPGMPRVGGGPLRLPVEGTRDPSSLAGPRPATDLGPQEDPSPTEAAFLNFVAPKPATWMRRPPENRMRLANWTVPAPSGGNQSELVVFGGIGGSVQQNVERWENQFRTPDGGPVAAEMRTLEVAGMPTTMVMLEGDYRGMNAWYTDDQVMLAAIVEPPASTPVQIRLVGDADTVRGQREAFEAFVEGIKVTGAPIDAGAPAPAAPVAPPPAPPAADEEGRATFAGYTAPVAEAWVARAPTNAMRAANWRVPGADGGADAELVVFAGIGGSTTANIERWAGQFRGADGGTVTPETTELDAGGLPVILVEIRGDYRGMTTSFVEDQLFLAAVVEGSAGAAPLQIRLVGDTATVEAHRPAFMAFVEGLRREG